MKNIQNIDIKNKKVLIRVDYNVPIERGVVKNNFRIIQSMKTIKYCLKQGASVILISHLGRPKNNSRDKLLSLRPVVAELSNLLNIDIKFSDSCISNKSIDTSNKLKKKDVHLLENLRFHAGEKNNCDNFSRLLSKHADIYVNDAFGTSHRAHASNVGVVKYMREASIGFLNMKELEYLSKKLSNPVRPYSFILGGVKVADKIKLIDNIKNNAEIIFIAGAMAFTFLRAKGFGIGNSYFERESLDIAKKIMNDTDKSGVELVLPIDAVVSRNINDVKNAIVKDIGLFDTTDCGFDIGPKTSSLFIDKLKESKTIVWNGPLGVAEKPTFAEGTNSVARFLNVLPNVSTIIGGGDTASCIYNILPKNNFSHISTGGGSSLELLSGNTLPAFEVLK